MKRIASYFSKAELIIWCSSVMLILLSFLLFDRESYLTLSASLLGVTSLIMSAKGHPAGQVLMIIFSILYGYISYTFAYYGEMITYIGMTLPMSVYALIAWLKNPYNGNRSEVKVGHVSKKEVAFMFILSAAVTLVFCFILKYFNTANLIPSTVSVTTSFIAVYLTARRSPYYAVAYAANDIVLMILWTAASFADSAYICVTVCFAVFLVNDIYGFISWRRMQKRQSASSTS